MGVRVNVRMQKIMCTPIKVGVRTYATYANSRTVYGLIEEKTSSVLDEVVSKSVHKYKEGDQ